MKMKQSCLIGVCILTARRGPLNLRILPPLIGRMWQNLYPAEMMLNVSTNGIRVTKV